MRKRRPQAAIGTRAPTDDPAGAEPALALDFATDVLRDGRRFRILAVVDDFTGSAWRWWPTAR